MALCGLASPYKILYQGEFVQYSKEKADNHTFLFAFSLFFIRFYHEKSRKMHHLDFFKIILSFMSQIMGIFVRFM